MCINLLKTSEFAIESRKEKLLREAVAAVVVGSLEFPIEISPASAAAKIMNASVIITVDHSIVVAVL